MTHYGHGHAPRSSSSRSRKPAKKKRQAPPTLVVGGAALLGLLILWGALVGWRVLGAKSDLDQATAQAETLKQALSDRDVQRAKSELGALQQSLESSDGKLDDLAVQAAAKIPFLGRNISSVRTVNTALLDIATDGLPPVVDKAASLGSDAFKPKDGTIDVSVVSDLAEPLQEAASVIEPANDQVQSLSTSGLVGPVANAVNQAKDKLSEAAGLTHKGALATKVLPEMLGANGARRYLLVFQNNAEIRSDGGLVGAWAELKVSKGKISLGVQGSGQELGDLPESATKLTAGERSLLTERIGWDLRDTVKTPDFARAAQLAANIVKKEKGVSVDGVISLDPVTLSYLLGATGSVQLEDGSELTGDNAVEQLLNKAYLNIPVPLQDAYFASAAQKIFSKVTSGSGDTSKLLDALNRATRERRILVWSGDDAVEKRLAGTPLVGSITDPSPAVGVYLNNYVSSKMDYYLRYNVVGTSQRCEGDVQTYDVAAHLRSVAPADAATLPAYIASNGDNAPAGTVGLDTLVLAPLGGQVQKVTVDGKKVATRRGELHGRPGVVVRVSLNPGARGVVKATIVSGKDQGGSTKLDVTPSVEPGNKSSTISSSCG